MKRLALAAPALLLLVAAVPAGASDVPPTLEACTDVPAGALVVTPAKTVTANPETPVGTFGVSVVESPEQVVVVDLAGSPEGTTADLQMTLSWDNPVVADYDLVVNGENDLSTDDPEFKSVVVDHCGTTRLGVEVFLGSPTDVLTLSLRARVKK
jgi:hypothetical protein